MPQQPRLRLLVISDLHAYCGQQDDHGPSAFHISGSDQKAAGLFDSCRSSLSEAGIETVDAVLCAGDLTDKAEPVALERVWSLLRDLASSLNAPLIATAGNHDMDSRGVHGVDPKESLLALQPFFPSGSEAGQQQYFTHHFTIDTIGPARILIVNSAAHHGTGQASSGPTRTNPHVLEHDHGRITPFTVRKIKNHLSELTDTRVGIVLTHHHPVQLPDIDTREASQMVDANALMQALQSDGQWLFIHGHKHRSYLHYAPGGAGSPVIFSAGSMGARMDGEFEQAVENQFFVVDVIRQDESLKLGLGLAGTIQTWTRDPLANGWRRAVPTDAFGDLSGFGYRADPSMLSQTIIQYLMDKPEGLTADDLAEKFPALPYLLPVDYQLTLSHLRRNPVCLVTTGMNGFFTRIDLVTPRDTQS